MAFQTVLTYCDGAMGSGFLMRRFTMSFLVSTGLAVATPSWSDVSLSVLGSDGDLRATLLAVSRLAELENPAAATGQEVLAAARADYSRLVAALYEQGYFGPEVSIRINGREAANISPFQSLTQHSDIEIFVDPGRAFTLGRADIAPIAPGTDLPEGFVTGARAGTPVLRQTAEAGISGWRDVGHGIAEISRQSITARQDDAELDVEITLAPGPVLTFGQLVPEGQQRMRPDAIGRIAGLPHGGQFSPAELDRAAERLRDTGAFSSVAFTELPPGPNDVMDIGATVVEAPLRRIGFGAEVSSDDGVGLSAYWVHRNLFGGAERLRLDAEVSGLGGESGGFDGLLSAIYTRPATFSPDTDLSFGVSLEHLDEVTYTEDSFEIYSALDHQFSERLSGSLGVTFAYSEIEDAFSRREETVFSLPGDLVWDSRDSDLDASRGWYLEGGLTPFASLTGGGAGARLTFDTRTYLGIGQENRTRFAARFQGGTLEGGDITTLPPDWLFFSGGAGTVRGQSYQSLGALQNGVDTGGRSYLGGSFELRQDLFGNFGAVGFVDTGFISADTGWSGDGEWHSGAGLGVRYDTAIGPIRLDVATQVGGDTAGDDFFLYIGIGHAF